MGRENRNAAAAAGFYRRAGCQTSRERIIEGRSGGGWRGGDRRGGWRRG